MGTITVKMWKKCIDRLEVEKSKNEVANWLYAQAGKVRFVDSALPEKFFKAKISSFDASASTRKACIITATFKADPYMYSVKEGGEKTI